MAVRWALELGVGKRFGLTPAGRADSIGFLIKGKMLNAIAPKEPEYNDQPRKQRYARVAAVSYLNAVPLIAGLEEDPTVKLLTNVPSSLLTMLENQKADVALVPSIDYQTSQSDLRILRAGAIGSRYQSMTVRIFSKKPIAQIKTLACDTDSHTSVILARIIFKEVYKKDIDVVRLRYEGQTVSSDTDAFLLIGDKVITAAIDPAFKAYELDLAEAWTKLTTLGFVFAIWVCKPSYKPDQVILTLKRALDYNLEHLPALAKLYAPEHHWPVKVATQYLTKNMYYLFDRPQLMALKRFYALCHKHKLIRRHKAIRFA